MKNETSSTLGWTVFALVISLSLCALFAFIGFKASETNYAQVLSAQLRADQNQEQPLKLERLKKPSDEDLADAQKLYNSNCMVCHGQEGRGDGAAAENQSTPPGDFHNKAAWKKGYLMTQIFASLASDFHQTALPSIKQLSDADKVKLAHYLRSFLDNPELDSDEQLKSILLENTL